MQKSTVFLTVRLRLLAREDAYEQLEALGVCPVRLAGDALERGRHVAWIVESIVAHEPVLHGQQRRGVHVLGCTKQSVHVSIYKIDDRTD